MTSSNTSIPAPQLYAEANGAKCQGERRCYWCGSPCTSLLRHNESPVQIGVKVSVAVKVRSSPYVCVGCWLFQAASTTARFMTSGQYMDRQQPSKHSWWITEKDARVIRTFVSGEVRSGGTAGQGRKGNTDHQALWESLLSPPPRFALALVTPGNPNLLQLTPVNSHDFTTGEQNWKVGSPLSFTVDNVPYSFTHYDLREALKYGVTEGKEPGVRKLIEFLGPPPAHLTSGLRAELERENAPAERGRPKGMSGKGTPQALDGKQLHQPIPKAEK